MPDCGERLAEENERRLETASYRDPPQNNYGAQMLERSLPLQQLQQQQQQSSGRKLTGGIMSRENYKGNPVEIRVPKWTDSKLWINSEDFEAAQYIADAAYHFTGRPPRHFPHVKFDYLPLRLSTGKELTTREECSAYVATIAKGSALRGQREDFKKRVQKLILEMVKRPEVVGFLNIVRASPRQASQPLLEANPEDTDSPFTNDENGTAMAVDAPSEEAIHPSQCGNLVPVAEWTLPFIAGDGGVENGTPMEIDSLSEEAIRSLTPTRPVDPAAVFQFDSTMTSFGVDAVDMSTAFIPSFDIDFYKSENFLTSAGQNFGIWHPPFGEKEKEDLVPDNCKELLASLDKDEEEIWKSLEPLDLELWSLHPPFVPDSPLLGSTCTESGWQSRGSTSVADVNEALRPPLRPILYQNRWRP